ncbi:unnamed protein product, partial [Amoebophrya sp. A120]
DLSNERWRHHISVLEIHAVEDSTGFPDLLAGTMRCPPERLSSDKTSKDEPGVRNAYNRFLKDLEAQFAKGCWGSFDNDFAVSSSFPPKLT